MNSDTQQIGIFCLFVLVIIFLVSSCEIKKTDSQTKLDVASAEAGLHQKCDATTGYVKIWVKQ